jgi:hypothetical protein
MWQKLVAAMVRATIGPRIFSRRLKSSRHGHERVSPRLSQFCQAQWHTSIILALRRLRQENCQVQGQPGLHTSFVKNLC